jgi:stearoyl-CoA desaturase (delta-9 desaturase)
MIPNKPTILLIFQIIAHLAIIPMIIYGAWWQWLIVLFVYFLNGCLGMTMTYHRLLSHKAWTPPKWMEYLFTLFATIGLTGSAISWVAIHREHHAHTDDELDPHSPHHKGFIYAHWLSMYSPVHIKYARHLLRDKFYNWQHKYYYEINLVYAAILFAIDPFAVVYAWLVPAMVLWNGGSSVVSISHRDGSTHSDLILALLVWGEGYHVEHHDRPASSRFGKWDLGGWLIERSGYIDR